MLARYVENPASVSEGWRDLFARVSQVAPEHSPPVTDDQNSTKPVEAEPVVSETKKPAIKKAAKTEPLEMGQENEYIPIRGSAARILDNMQTSLTIPTATSQRAVPVKVLEENRRLINQYYTESKVSFTHVIAWAIVRALETYPHDRR